MTQQPREGKIYFAGEYTNKFFQGWVESALESAVRVLVDIWPEKYEKDFGEKERKEFARDNTQRFLPGIY